MTEQVTRANVDYAKQIGLARVGNDYVYGGNWRRDDDSVGTDCSGLVIDICDAVRNGPNMAWSRHGMSTESWRPIEVGDTGTMFDTVCVAHPADFPPDAVVKIALHHGPGGGANSHMWCEVDGVRLESNGSDGCVTGNQAMSVYDTTYANDWHYIPGPIGGGSSVNGSGVDDAVDVLAWAMGNQVSESRYRELLPAASKALADCDCTTVDRIAMWCAQVGHESGGLQWMEELASGAAYEGRNDLGNTQPGDGVRFKGRGPIQVTGRANYAGLSQWAHGQGLVPTPTFFVDDPAELSSDRYGFVGVVWYWTVARPMNSYADRGDIIGATRAVNGGTNGIDDRTARWNRCRAMGEELLQLLPDQHPADSIEEELLMLTAASMSIYATPGEPPVPVVDMIRALDAHGPHEPYVERQAELGDPDALARVARTAAGKGIYGKAPGPVAQATAVLARISGKTTAEITAQLKGTAA